MKTVMVHLNCSIYYLTIFLNKKYIPQNLEEIKQPKLTPTDCSQLLNIKTYPLAGFSQLWLISNFFFSTSSFHINDIIPAD